MSGIFRNLKTLIGLALLLVGGFAVTGVISYHAANNVVKDSYQSLALPEAVELVSAQLHTELLDLAQASEKIANDAVVRSWAGGGEDSQRLAHELLETKRHYDLGGIFLVSTRTRQQYREGAYSIASGAVALDEFVQSQGSRSSAYQVNPNVDGSDGDAAAIGALHRIVEGGRVAGVAVAGLSNRRLQRLINQHQSRFGGRIRLVDRTGIVVVGDGAMRHIKDLPGLRDVADAVLSPAAGAKATARYGSLHNLTFVSASLVPELNLYLVVEQSSQMPMRKILAATSLNAALAAAVVLVAVLWVVWSLSEKPRLGDDVPGMDPVTGLMNWSAYVFVCSQTLIETTRAEEPLCLIMVQVDRFARIAERLGPDLRDAVLRQIAELSRKAVRGSDPVARWHDDKFVIQLRDCPLDRAVVIGERLRQSISSSDFGLAERKETITASLGVALHGENEERDDFLVRLEEALEESSGKGGDALTASTFIPKPEND